ncbi:MAG: NAD(P)(+) transhydrogenase (Re/Si-specific) subunit beta [Saprospiraceae bacterium]|nr:NAD(P)(+) transhydrogenase (Re/Si-specific) subunit beta [Saprospiraceae bacterium]
MYIAAIVKVAYLLGALAIVWGLKYLSSPDSARKGNLLASAGMGLAIVTAILEPLEGASNNYLWILLALAIGTLIGWYKSKKVQMTDMPQLVSLFNGLGGASAMVLAIIEFSKIGDAVITLGAGLILISTLIIGAVSFTGSVLAYLKLDGKVEDKNVTFRGHNTVNNIFAVVILGVAIWCLLEGEGQYMFFGWILLALSLVYGFSFVAPIGGADMPVVISLLNSLTGISAATAGVLFDNQIMLVGGILVGASGTILTVLMCNAMNRSLWNVIVGNFGGSSSGAVAGAAGVYREVTTSDLAIQLYYSQRVIIVPGYGLAVSQAQKVCQELDAILSKNNVEVFYAIHPVAGRMPGHMNVLLAEANVSYEKLLTLEEANEKFKGCNVSIIVGANDVVNPAAKTDPSSPIYGMPILDVLDSDSVVILKRSMKPGYAGIENPLFFEDKSKMLFGDAKDSLNKLIQEIKSVAG